MDIGLAMERKVLGDRYEVQKQLGKRTGRRTLLVRDLKTQELAVIKLLLFGGDFQWDDLKLFQREAEVLKFLSHSAIPRYLDFFDLNTPNLKGFALVQTYIDAKSLDEQVKAGRRFTEAEVQQLANIEAPLRAIKASGRLNSLFGQEYGSINLMEICCMELSRIWNG